MQAPNLEDALSSALKRRRQSWPKAMKIWPSDLGDALGPDYGGGCQLAYWHKCRDAETKDLSYGQLLMFMAGDAMHELVVDLLRDELPLQGWRVVAWEERTRKFGISGRLDIEIEHIESGARRVIDVKSKRGGAFRYLNEPKPGDVLQVQFYEAARESDGGDLLYVDREGQNGAVHFPVERNDARPEHAVQVLEEIRDSEEPPPPMTPTLARRKNKGPDSLYLNLPWQVEWCNLKKCPCAESCGKVPDGIVAKVQADGELTFTKEGEPHRELIEALFEEMFADEYR